jgi:hypothetical protein
MKMLTNLIQPKFAKNLNFNCALLEKAHKNHISIFSLIAVLTFLTFNFKVFTSLVHKISSYCTTMFNSNNHK